MTYKVVITKHANRLLDGIISHLTHQYENKQAAIHLLDCLNKVYDRLEDNPLQFPESKDAFLQIKGYRVATLSGMGYVVIYSLDEPGGIVNVSGIFHQLENYREKL